MERAVNSVITFLREVISVVTPKGLEWSGGAGTRMERLGLHGLGLVRQGMGC
jgi:hypothetical protein